jgi:hypothetical protein
MACFHQRHKHAKEAEADDGWSLDLPPAIVNGAKGVELPLIGLALDYLCRQSDC